MGNTNVAFFFISLVFIGFIMLITIAGFTTELVIPLVNLEQEIISESRYDPTKKKNMLEVITRR